MKLADRIGRVAGSVGQNRNFILVVVDAEPSAQHGLAVQHSWSTHAKPSCGPQLFLLRPLQATAHANVESRERIVRYRTALRPGCFPSR